MSFSLSEKYKAAAVAHVIASEKGDHKTANNRFSDLMNVLVEIRNESDKGAHILRGLLNDEPRVICWAATHLLPLSELEAKNALTILAKENPGVVGLNAKMVLREWAAGRLKIP